DVVHRLPAHGERLAQQPHLDRAQLPRRARRRREEDAARQRQGAVPARPARPAAVTAVPALAGLRVLELATEIAGPYCGKLLADAGAEVGKAEPPGGDALRARRSGALF